MNLTEIMYLLLPKKYQEALKKEAEYAGMGAKYKIFVFNTIAFFLLLIIIASITSVYLLNLPSSSVLLAAIILGILSIFMPYLLITLAAESRRKNIEELLPDILLLTSSNLKSGLTIDKAMLFSARSEFGIISEYFRKAAFKIYGGKSVEESLLEITKKIKSNILERTIYLLIEGIRSGGEIAKLLEESAADIRNTQTLQKEIKANVRMYVMFILLAAVIAAPFLFAISNYLFNSTYEIQSKQVGMAEIPQSPIGMISISRGEFLIDPQFFRYFTISAVLISTIFGSLIISLIQNGTIKPGFKYIPIFSLLSLIIFFGGSKLLEKFLGVLIA